MEHHMVCTPHQILNFPISPRCFIQLYIFFLLTEDSFRVHIVQIDCYISWCPLEQHPSLPAYSAFHDFRSFKKFSVVVVQDTLHSGFFCFFSKDTFRINCICIQYFFLLVLILYFRYVKYLQVSENKTIESDIFRESLLNVYPLHYNPIHFLY